MYKTITRPYSKTTIIKKSSFIAQIFPVQNIEEVDKIIADVNKEHFHATHNCYAYVLQNQSVQKYNDDGEPTRTAGYPILNTLLQNELDNILCIVTRYFGGVKLGAGGLIRAYANSTTEVLNIAELIVHQEFFKYEISFSYQYTDQINYLIDIYEGEILKKHFYDFVVYEISLSQNNLSIIEKIVELTKNTALIKKI